MEYRSLQNKATIDPLCLSFAVFEFSNHEKCGIAVVLDVSQLFDDKFILNWFPLVEG